MKRDMDLIRELLLDAEARAEGWSSSEVDIEGSNDETITYHIRLLIDKGLLDGACTPLMGGGKAEYYCHVNRLTFDGHDFLDNIRDLKVFNKIKEEATNRGIALTLDAIVHLAQHLVRQACNTLWT